MAQTSPSSWLGSNICHDICSKVILQVKSSHVCLYSILSLHMQGPSEYKLFSLSPKAVEQVRQHSQVNLQFPFIRRWLDCVPLYTDLFVPLMRKLTYIRPGLKDIMWFAKHNAIWRGESCLTHSGRSPVRQKINVMRWPRHDSWYGSFSQRQQGNKCRSSLSCIGNTQDMVARAE